MPAANGDSGRRSRMGVKVKGLRACAWSSSNGNYFDHNISV